MNKRRTKKAFRKLIEGRVPTEKEISSILAKCVPQFRSVVAMTIAARRVVDSMSKMAAAFGGLSKSKLFHRGEMDN